MAVIDKTKIIKVNKYNNQVVTELEDHIVVEQPLEIRLSSGSIQDRNTESIYVTMRTPGEDKLLALGFLFTENIIQSLDHVYKIASLNDDVILVELQPGFTYNFKNSERNFLSNSSCGICGKTSISAIHNHRYVRSNHTDQVSSKLVISLRNKIADKQSIFNQTGGLHSASLFDFDGNLIAIFEDVGRHNALDKLIGHMLEKKLENMHKYLFLLSGRLGFELIHKTLKIGVSVLIAIGSPSSLSVDIAAKNGLCLIGFLKDSSFNIYSEVDRVLLEES